MIGPFHFRFLRHGLYTDLVVQECILYTRLASNLEMQLPLPPCLVHHHTSWVFSCICFYGISTIVLSLVILVPYHSVVSTIPF